MEHRIAEQPALAASTPGFDQQVPHNGYRWWYLDAFSDDGTAGLTVIVFVGSVFSPYYFRARRQGRGQPENFCSINVILYGPKRNYWTLTERDQAVVSRSANHFAVGPSQVEFRDGELQFAIRERCAPIPQRVSGTIRVALPQLSERCFALDQFAQHRWWPAAPSSRVSVAFDNPDLQWQGQGYFDSNAGVVPVEETFRGWQWLRTEGSGQGGHILYETQPRIGEPQQLTLAYDQRGSSSEVALTERGRHLPTTPIWRVGRPMPVGARGAKVVKTFEDTPFYARTEIDVDIAGNSARAMHESLDLDRFKSRWVQTLLPFRMPRRAGW